MIFEKRASGILLHITSLPSNSGIGNLGPYAYRFVDLLAETKQSYWQTLPLTPTDLEHENSPYIASSSFAGNTLLISPELLVNEQLLSENLTNLSLDLPHKKVDYGVVYKLKSETIRKAYEVFKKKIRNYPDFEDFCDRNSKWLDDYALYKALKDKNSLPWYLWPSHLRDREKRALAEKKENLKDSIGLERFAQFIFFRQWHSLREYLKRKGLSIIGDLPFYVGYDSADAWSHPKIFKLDTEKKPLFVSGVPPDYLSKTGQLWGTPVYDWEELAASNFEWWMERIDHNMQLFNILRIDHFRGLIAYWEVPAEANTAINGRWVKTNSEDFFKTLTSRFPDLPFIAEDLGIITADVKEVINKFNIPGMKVLLFAFDGSSDNPHLPHNYSRNSVVLTGTHDTNTVREWFAKEATLEEKNILIKYLGKHLSEEEVSWEFIKLAMNSTANLSIIPLQDVLSLGAEGRMNNPAMSVNNWGWRVTEEQLMGDMFGKLGKITETSERC
jgi:4-alpha-glucanotransferase